MNGVGARTPTRGRAYTRTGAPTRAGRRGGVRALLEYPTSRCQSAATGAACATGDDPRRLSPAYPSHTRRRLCHDLPQDDWAYVVATTRSSVGRRYRISAEIMTGSRSAFAWTDRDRDEEHEQATRRTYPYLYVFGECTRAQRCVSDTRPHSLSTARELRRSRRLRSRAPRRGSAPNRRRRRAVPRPPTSGL